MQYAFTMCVLGGGGEGGGQRAEGGGQRAEGGQRVLS